MTNSKEKIISILRRHKDMYFGDRQYDGIHFTLEDVADLMEEQPQVVRCRDCKWYQAGYQGIIGNYVCVLDHGGTPDWFCADGKQKE